MSYIADIIRLRPMWFLMITAILAGCSSDCIRQESPEQHPVQTRSCGSDSTLHPLDDVMMQAFYWDVPVDEASLDGSWWDNLRDKADELKASGISALWTPVPCKGNWGITDNGYGIYDHYDLGNYDRKGSVETRFGSRAELEAMLDAMHRTPRIEVYSDVVLNHVYSGDDNEEVNPAVKAYVFNEANDGRYMPYPASDIRWVIPDAEAGDYYIQIKGYCLPWSAPVTERGYDLTIRWDDSKVSTHYVWEHEPNNGNGSWNVFPGSGETVRGHIGNKTDIDEYKITLSIRHDIEIRISAKRETGSPMQWTDAGRMHGFYPVSIWYNSTDLAPDRLEARTNTHIVYPVRTGEGEADYEWNYSHFHPVDTYDWLGGYGSDEIVTNTIFFGNDFNTFDSVVRTRLNDWGRWLIDKIGFDGFRLDFVRGFQEAFVAEWVNSLPPVNGARPFVVGEYWGADYRIREWVNNVAALGAYVSAFDFPLKNTLTDMCNKSGGDFNMSLLNHAGLVRNSNGNSLPASSVVTFLDNHDTGKEHDKWVTKDFHLGYAYLLTHEGRPCVFYPHFFGDTQYDADDKSQSVTPPAELKSTMQQLINIRKTYIGGTITVLSETGTPYPSRNISDLYIARRQGNGIKDGAIIVLNNHDSESKAMWVTVNAGGFSDWSGKTLVNVLNPVEKVMVQSDGRVELGAPARDYTVWVLQEDMTK